MPLPDPDTQPRVQVDPGAVSEIRHTVTAPRGPLRGQVVRDRAAVANAVVTATRVPSLGDSWHSLSPWSWGEHPRVTVTDAAGRFALPDVFATDEFLPRAFPAHGGAGAVAARAGQDATVFVPVTATLAGRITGRPPARFVVRAADSLGNVVSQAFAHTDGRWAFTELASGEYELVVVSRSGCATARHVLTAASRDEVRLDLTPPGGVRGWVLEASGARASGAVVTLRYAEAWGEDIDAGLPPLTAITDAEGRFAILGACAGPNQVFAAKEAGETMQDIPLAAGRVAEVTLRLQ